MTQGAQRLGAAVLFAIFVSASLSGQKQDGVDILLGKARSLEARGRIDLAAQNWGQVLLVDPNQREALAGLARQAKQDGDSNNLRLYLDRLRKINPSDPAITAIERMRVLTPQDRARLDEAGRLASQKRSDEAMKIYREVFGNEPPWGRWAEPFYDTLATSTGGRDDAIAQLRQLASRDPGNEVYRLWLARILSYDPKTRMEALRLLESIHDSGTVEQARTVWRQGLVWEKDSPAAQASLQAYVQRYPDKELQEAVTRLQQNKAREIQGAERERGFEALRGKDVTTAQQKFEDVLRRSPGDVNAMAGLGFVRLEQKRFREASTLFDKARALAPQRSDIREGYETAQYWSAMERGAFLQGRDPDAAIAAYQDALAIRPQEEQPSLAIAQIMLEKKNLAEAGAGFERILERAPNNAVATIGLGFVRLNQKNFDEAANLLGRGRTMSPDNRDVEEGYRTARFWGLMTKASAALEENRLEAAVSGFEEAVTISPSDKDALLGLAGAAERSHQDKLALSAYERLAAAASNETRAWLGLMRLQVNTGNPAAALATSQRIPASLKNDLETRPDYLASLSLILLATKRQSEGEQMLRRALDAAEQSDSDEAVNLRLQAASMLTTSGNTGLALSIYKQATDDHPGLVNAWHGLIGVYTSTGEFGHAMATLRAMPRNTYEAAARDSAFLSTAATAYAADGRCDDAERLLTRSLDLDKAAGRSPAPGTQLQLADIWMRKGQYDRAVPAYRSVLSVDGQSVDAWRGYLTALHNQGDDRTVIGEAGRIPAATRSMLGNEPGFLTLLASAQSTAGRYDQAVSLLEEARARYRAQGQPVPADLELQLGWAMVSSSQAAGAGDLIGTMRGRTDLTLVQRAALDELWSAWTLGRGDAAMKADQNERAIAILTDAWQQMPNNPRMPSALAAMHLRQDHRTEALDVYRSWGMAGASAGDYRAAAGTALATHDTTFADSLLRQGLQRFPNDSELLHMSGRRAVSQGSYKDAERLLAAALAAAKPGTSGSEVKPVSQPAPSTSRSRIETAPATGSCRQDLTRAVPDGPGIQLASLRRIVSAPLAERSGWSAINVAQAQQSGAEQGGSEQRRDPQQVEQLEEDIDTVRNRNTPAVAGTFTFAGRSGDPGINRLVVSDYSPLGSAAVADKVRFGIDVHGVSLDSGTPDGRSEMRFGTLPPGETFPEQRASGFGGEAQLSTDVFGLMFGTSPTGFLASTWTGGFRIGVPDGPVRLTVVRDLVKDSMLSYAGARDPLTGEVWGGVVSNSASAQFSHDSSGTGQYLSVSAGLLRGQNVQDNWNAEGSAGMYWGVAVSDRGQLTVGLNATGMHYARNLNFFSFGHGGYFSPQRLVQASVPFTWSAKQGPVSYEILASPGYQYFAEDASPYYPLGITVEPEPFAPLVYDAHEHQGPNYNVRFRANYRLAPHWHVDVFAAANNTRDFDSRTVGVTLKLLARPLPTSGDLRVKGIPDWRGNRAFGF
jgi:tetratricopeptide (TPR) repeat protein